MGVFSKHGESVKHVLYSWAVVILTAGVLFPVVGGVKDATGTEYAITALSELATTAGWREVLLNIYFSIITFSTIGYGDLSPAGPSSRVLVAVESLIGALLVALLVFLLGRRTTW